MKQKGLNRKMLTYMYGNGIDLFSRKKEDKGTGEPRKMKRMQIL